MKKVHAPLQNGYSISMQGYIQVDNSGRNINLNLQCSTTMLSSVPTDSSTAQNQLIIVTIDGSCTNRHLANNCHLPLNMVQSPTRSSKSFYDGVLASFQTQNEFISRQELLLFISIPTADLYGSLKALEIQHISDEPMRPSHSLLLTNSLPPSLLGRTATKVAPLRTTPSRSSRQGAYHSRILRAGTRVRCELPAVDDGFTLNSCNCFCPIVSNPCPSTSVSSKVSRVSCSLMIGWRR